MMVGLMSISKGDIIISGHSVKNEFEQAIAQVGAIVENPEMYKFLTGYQNLVHFARMSPGITKERIAETIERVGLTARIHDKNGKLIDVRNLRAEAGADVLAEVAFEVNDAPRAAELISEATVQGNAIVIRLSREQIPDLNARLVSEGFQVYGIRNVTHTLEDQFLQVTGGGSIG
ncbi:hypothetical protein G195_001029 [Phytophthora kernoviae 00238/432]|uniref:Uncharacterized protein n=1 Tax=Phytophthora kernoviae 00238/432 TaxID=1284355 RepID=A0A8J4WH62_9STRA|nr:hypothetical protein G195_001029 [Phytophthora kernoviae 00238/432]